MKSFCFLDDHTHSLWIWRGGTWVALGNTYAHKTINFKFLFEMTKKKEWRKKKKKRIINAHYRHPQPDHTTSSSFSLSLSFSLCSHSSITFSRLCNHTHTHNHNNMFSLRTTRACVLFFVQIFPSLFSTIAVFWSLKERRERERER